MKSACWWRLILQEFTWVKSNLTAQGRSFAVHNSRKLVKLFWALYFSSAVIKTCTKHWDKVIETLIILWSFAGLAEVHPCLTVAGSQDWTLHSRCDLSSSWAEGRHHIPGDAFPNPRCCWSSLPQGHVGGFCSAEHPPGPSCFPVDCFPPILYWWLGFFLPHFPILNSTRLLFTQCLWCLDVSEDYFLHHLPRA